MRVHTLHLSRSCAPGSYVDSHPVRLVIVSDTHCAPPPVASVPDGDVFIHAGDATNHGTLPELEAFGTWLAALPHPHKFIVGGNHDYGMQVRSCPWVCPCAMSCMGSLLSQRWSAIRTLHAA